MTGVKKALNGQAEVMLGTVNQPSFNGQFGVVLLAFASSTTEAAPAGDALQSVRKRNGKTVKNSKSLSAVKDRFDDVECTLIDGVNYDEPTYVRRHIRLKR
jgi:hypothetical protein